jgi:hypothetical protein
MSPQIKQLVSLEICFGLLSWLCQEEIQTTFSFSKYLDEERNPVASSKSRRTGERL